MTRLSETDATPAALAAASQDRLTAASPAVDSRSLLSCYMELGKVRLSAMVVVTTAVGYTVAAKGASTNFDLAHLLWTCLGTFLAAVGASAFNQAWEHARDARMKRTQNRPVPTRRISPAHASFVGLLASIAGVAILCPTSNGLTATLATANIIVYALIYTPLKTISTANTLVGAIVGAVPPMIGWSAATNSLSAGAWVLGAVLFAWQIPHFLALAWMYRNEYLNAGFKMISTVEPTGRLTTILAVLYSLALIPIAAGMTFLGHAGWPFVVASTVLGVARVCLALRFAATRAHADARRLFFATIIYLPLLSAALVLDARGPFDHYLRGDAGYSSPPPSGETFVDPGAPQ